MKLNFTLTLFTVLVATVFATAQTTHEVDCSGLVFTPANITIDEGDTVNWTNSGGNHNVNATTETYPDNPESFGNALGMGWTFAHTFTIPGVYDYQCDAHVGAGMVGTVTVLATTSVDEVAAVEVSVNVFPQPASEFVVFDIQNAGDNLMLFVYDLKGRVVNQSQVFSGSEAKVDCADWTNGTYVYQLKSTDTVLVSGTLMVK